MHDLYPRHEHHTAAADIDTSLPRGNGIFVHAFLQFLAWAVVFPLGMVLGLKKSKWHVPCQVAGLALTGTGFILGEFSREEAGRRKLTKHRGVWTGHHHGGQREYAASVRPSHSLPGRTTRNLECRY